jgi:menaquinol-cytochrome c reductase cytochrome b/c subunit
MSNEVQDAPDVSTEPSAHGHKPVNSNDRQRAFKRYKEETARTGKPFFPYGVWHDVIAATVVLGIILLLTVVWFAQANCDSWWNPTCDHAATPAEQHRYTPDNPNEEPSFKDNGELEDGDAPILGPLYEEKADPATTSYHPRPEWYFYFLFYLLIVFSEPNTVILGTIGLPTIWLMLLMAWPFIDRKRERRPSRRPIAMGAMAVTAVMLLTFTYLGSKAGEESVEGIEAAQQEMPGFKLIFEDPRGATCKGCHVIGGSGGSVGPGLDEEGTKDRGIEWQIQHLINPPSKVPGSSMPAQKGIFNDEEIAQLAAFLETLGRPERAEDSEYTDVDASTTEEATGEGGEGEGGEDKSQDPDAGTDTKGGQETVG